MYANDGAKGSVGWKRLLGAGVALAIGLACRSDGNSTADDAGSENNNVTGGAVGGGGNGSSPSGGNPGAVGGTSAMPAGGSPGSGGEGGAPASGGVRGTGGITATGGTPTTGGTEGACGPQPIRPTVTTQPAAIQFVLQPIGVSSESHSLTFTNSSAVPIGPLTHALFGDDKDFSVNPDGCAITIQPKATCSVAIRFIPSASGRRRAALYSTDARGTRSVTDLVGIGVSANASIEVSPRELLLEGAIIGQTSTRTIVVTNRGMTASGTPTANFTTGANGFTIVSRCNGSLAPQASCELDLNYKPSTAGLRTVLASVTANPGTSTTIEANAIGTTGVRLSISPASHDLGSIILPTDGEPPSVLYTVTNVGSVASSLLKLLDNVVDRVHVMADGCSGKQLSPGATCTFRAMPGNAVSVKNAPGRFHSTINLESGKDAVAHAGLEFTLVNAGLGLAGHWRFDENANVNVRDCTVKGNHGTIRKGSNFNPAATHDAPIWTTSGLAGAALKFNGVDEWVEIPASPSLPAQGFAAGVSISAWVRPDTHPDGYAVAVRRGAISSNDDHYMLGLQKGRVAGGIHFFNTISDFVVPVGQWTHIAMTYDSFALRLFANGNMVAKEDIGWPLSADTTPVTIGAGINWLAVGDFFHGLIDEVRLYDFALPVGEVFLLAGAH
jgi:Concanavalin A-like lectin/glucanases superfamily